METVNINFDKGKPFDWGRTSSDYAKFRDIYPEDFYSRIVKLNLCTAGQSVLDVGTGTGVIPRNMYRYGAKWIGADISENQIEQARILSKGMNIDYRVSSAEDLNFPGNSFDVITACQCFGYFDHKKVSKKFYGMLKSNGSILVMYMAWLPFEDEIAKMSEDLVLKYNPDWSGAGETVRKIDIPDCYGENFELVHSVEFKLNVPFTRESWHGRIKACRGIGASLQKNEISEWEKEHKKLLAQIAPEKFDILHYGALAQLRKID